MIERIAHSKCPNCREVSLVYMPAQYHKYPYSWTDMTEKHERRLSV